MTPERTSPLPAVARAGRPAAARRTSGATAASGDATAVSGPLRSTTAPVVSARYRAAASRSSPGGRPARRAYSPSWGVRMHGAWRVASNARADAASPRARSASASTTSGTGALATTVRISSAVVSPVPSPGPTTTARHLDVPSKKAPAQPSAGRCRRTASVGQAAAGSPGGARRIMPAPAAMAPRVQSTAAPSMPAEPAATPTAVVHLFTCRARGGSRVATSPSSTSAAPGTGREIPMSATSTAPASRGPSPWSSPVLRAAKVTVTSARTASPGASPVSASTPDGTSIASTRAPSGGRGAS